MSTATLPALNGHHATQPAIPNRGSAFSLTDIQGMAETVAKSGLFPGITTPQAACALMLLCQAEGLHPMQALKRYHIIEGRPSMRADAMQAEFQGRGGWIRWIKHSDEEASATFGHKVHCPDGVTLSMNVKTFHATGVAIGKYGVKDNWKKFPGAMLRARLISAGVRMVDPGCITGMYAPEEVVDFGPDGIPPEVAVTSSLPVVPQNNSGFGRGQYASPAQIEGYQAAVRSFLDKQNADWAAWWVDMATGEPIDGIPPLINHWQAHAHLLKWAVNCGLLDPAIVPEDTKLRQPPMYLAIVYHRSDEDCKALKRELKRYVQVQIDEKTRAIRRKFPELSPDYFQDIAEDASQEPAVKAEDASQVIDVEATDEDNEAWEEGRE